MFRQMKYSVSIAFLLILMTFSCRKEIIVPIQSETEEIIPTRGSNRDPISGDGDNSGVTDPDDETEDDKIKSKKRKAR